MSNNEPDDESTTDSQQESEQQPADSDQPSAQSDEQPADSDRPAEQCNRKPANESEQSPKQSASNADHAVSIDLNEYPELVALGHASSWEEYVRDIVGVDPAIFSDEQQAS